MITEFHEHFLRREIKEDEKRSAIIFAIEGICILTLFFYVLYLNKQLLQTKSDFEKKQISSTATTPHTTPTPTLIPYTQNAKTSVNPTQPPVAKDYYVPLGTGISSAFEWTSVPGAQVKLDFSSYERIKAVYFEASTFVPTGNESISLRLFNITDQHAVWNSEFTVDANTVDIKTSEPLIYDTGEKTYQVQMKTQLQTPANLTNSRIHIVLK